MKTSLIILTLNEIECLSALFDKIPLPSEQSGYDEIVAVDGGSTDGTIEFFKERNIRIIGQSKRGRGEAFHNAFRELDSDLFIFFSPDGNEDMSDLPKFKKIVQEKNADIVIASRMTKGSVNEEDHQLFKWRKWANNAFNVACNLCIQKNDPYITYYINGYRAVTKQAFLKLDLDAQDYTIEYQMTMRAMKRGLNVVEFSTIEGQRVAGDTGAPSISTGLKFIRCFFRELLIR